MFEGVTEEMLAKARAENDALMAAEELLRDAGYVVEFHHNPPPTSEELAVIGLRAWNDVPADYPFTWPKDFPEGSRAAWRRVAAAIVAASSNGRTPHFDCGDEGSSPSAASTSTPNK